MDELQAEQLFRKYRQTRDISIRNKLVENYIYIAEILAKKFAGRGVEYDDLLQIASEALIEGVEKFDPDLGNKFTTFITPTVTGIIKNYFRDFSRSMRIPRRLYTLSAKIKRAAQESYMQTGVKPTVKQLSEKLGVDEELIIEAMECKSPSSLDAAVETEEGDDSPALDALASGGDDFERLEDADALKSTLKLLDDEEKKIVSLRFFDGKSQAEVGKALGVSQMYISRAERKIVQKLKEAMSDD